MNPDALKKIQKPHICELCLRHDPMVKNYSEDFELQTAIRNYIEKATGDVVNIDDIAHLCDSCYVLVQDMAKQKDF